MTLTPRARAQAIATRRGGRHTLAVPLALRLAARIQERPLDDFFTDPTQLANGLNDLLDAIGPDGLVVTDPAVLADEVASVPAAGLPSSVRTGTALEATRRLKSTVGDTAVLVAVLPGPATIAEARGDVRAGGEIAEALGKAFLGAGIDVIVFSEPENMPFGDFEPSLRTIANMARFHRALTYLAGAKVSFVDAPAVVPLEDPRPAEGLVLTEEDLPTDTDITAVQDWVAAIRA